jgi:hypothetical protein
MAGAPSGVVASLLMSSILALSVLAASRSPALVAAVMEAVRAFTQSALAFRQAASHTALALAMAVS